MKKNLSKSSSFCLDDMSSIKDYEISSKEVSIDADKEAKLEKAFSSFKLNDQELQHKNYGNERLPIFKALDVQNIEKEKKPKIKSSKNIASEQGKVSSIHNSQQFNKKSQINENTDLYGKDKLKSQDYPSSMHQHNMYSGYKSNAYMPMKYPINYAGYSSNFKNIQYPEYYHFQCNPQNMFLQYNNICFPQGVPQQQTTNVNTGNNIVAEIVSKLNNMDFNKISKSELNKIKEKISKVKHQNELNDLVAKISPILDLIVTNKIGTKIFYAIIANLQVQQRLTLWRAIVTYVNNYNNFTNDCIAQLISLKESKSEEVFIINIIKPAFPTLAKDSFGCSILQIILNKFTDEAKYILISFIHENLLCLSEHESGIELIICFLSQTIDKPFKIKEGFILSIKPVTFHLLMSKEGHKILNYIIQKWNINLWNYIKESILKNTFILLMNKYFYKVLQELSKTIDSVRLNIIYI